MPGMCLAESPGVSLSSTQHRESCATQVYPCKLWSGHLRRTFALRVNKQGSFKSQQAGSAPQPQINPHTSPLARLDPCSTPGEVEGVRLGQLRRVWPAQDAVARPAGLGGHLVRLLSAIDLLLGEPNKRKRNTSSLNSDSFPKWTKKHPSTHSHKPLALYK